VVPVPSVVGMEGTTWLSMGKAGGGAVIAGTSSTPAPSGWMGVVWRSSACRSVRGSCGGGERGGEGMISGEDVAVLPSVRSAVGDFCGGGVKQRASWSLMMQSVRVGIVVGMESVEVGEL